MKSGKGRIAAFFDVDGTLLKKTSDIFIINELYRRRIIRLRDIIRFYYYNFLHKANLLDIDQVKKFLKFLKGVKKDEAERIVRDSFNKKMKHNISRIMINEIKMHKKKRHIVVLISNSPEIIVKRFKDYLNADMIECTRLELKAGVYTGRIIRFCYGLYKNSCILNLKNSIGIDMKNSYFYSDSFSDMPMFNMVGNRVAVNPDLKLRIYAKKHGWRIIDY